jgi:dephospho-CoA kinase
MITLGLTGGIGAGKSTVGKHLRRIGIKVIEADDLVHECFKRKQIQERIIRIFGRKILNSNERIDKKKISEVVFQNQKNLKKLEGILHPPVIREIKKELSKRKQKHGLQFIAVIVPLLFEKCLQGLFDKTIVVMSPKRLRILRAAKHLKIKPEEVIDRMRHQFHSSKQKKLADFVIQNTKTKNQLKKEVEKLIQKLKEE